MKNLIEIKNLSYSYDDFDDEKNEKSITKALDCINLDIKENEFVAILGHNGSGKSTLAKLLNAQILPTQGDIYYLGMNTKDEDKIWKIRELSSMVFQNPDNQMVATTVEEDVAFGVENLQIQNPELRQRVDKALELVSMQDYKKKSPDQLSGGQKQRVSIAGVIAMMSRCIVLDEPTAMLDPNGRKDVVNIVNNLHKRYNKTIVYITHYMEEAVNADKIVVLNKGKIAMIGDAHEVFGNVEKMKQLGLDVPQVTELAYNLKKRGINFDKMPLTIKELLEQI
ncbi:MAG: energy-coupling factor transporter ATPase [Tissierellia bacterium]|nr:energy-coupling factor transporter ATPase [Tissierellia bacterium]